MSSTFQFELVSPEKMLVSKPAVLATLPGAEGVFGVLADHAPLITSVAHGVIDVCAHDEATITDRYFVAGGFVEVTPTSCTVLAEEAVSVADMDRVQLEQTQRDLVDRMATVPAHDRAALEKQLAIVSAKMAVV